MEQQLLHSSSSFISPARIETIVHRFVWQLLAHLGHSPELDVCVVYRHPLRFPVVFQPDHGGLACGQCSTPGHSQLWQQDVSQLRQLLTLSAHLVARQEDQPLLNPTAKKTIWTYFQWQASDYQSRLQFFGLNLNRKNYDPLVKMPSILEKKKNMV